MRPKVNSAWRSYVRAAVLPVLVSLAGLAACTSTGPPPLTDLNALPTNTAKVLWRERVGPVGVGFVSALIDDRLWIANQRGEVMALDPATGETLGDFDLDRELSTGVAGDESTLVVVDADGNMLGVDPTGKERWTVDLGAEPLTIPVIQAGQVLVRLSNSTIVSYDLASGQRRWLFAEQNPALVLRQNAAISADFSNAYVGLANGRVVAISLSTGASRWQARISSPRGANEIERITDVMGSPVLTGAGVCAAAYQGRLTCVDSTNGQELWTEDVNAGTSVAIDSRVMVVGDVDGGLRAFTRSQLPLWEQNALRGRRIANPALIGEHVWVGDAGGVIHVLDRTDGRVTGRIETNESPIVSAPVAIDAGGSTTAFAMTADGHVVAMTLQ
ncbi:MAG: outer membrane protein assembly factor BamB [Burkholderiaceae bacterium]